MGKEQMKTVKDEDKKQKGDFIAPQDKISQYLTKVERDVHTIVAIKNQ